MKKLPIYLVCLIFIFGFCRVVNAQEAETAKADIQKLKQQFQQMQQQLEALKKQHAAEIESLQLEHQKEIAALKEQIKAIRPGQAAVPPAATDEAAELRRLAAGLLKEEKPAEKPDKEKVFTAGGLSLQALNPELSVTGDMLGYYQNRKDTRQRSDFIFRELGLHFTSYLDPYSRFKATIPVNQDGAELEEAYFTRFGIFDGANLTLGKFRQQFGVVNRWHKHGLDQVDFPLPLQMIFGDEGLNQTGVSLDWALPGGDAVSQELTFQVTNTQNDRLFGGDTRGNPCLLVHYKNYRDLSESTYLELGFSGLFGWNDRWDVSRAGVLTQQHNTLGTQVFGLDSVLTWEPTDRMRYRNIEWRSELYLLNRDLLAPDGSGKDSLQAWGAYSYIQSKVSRTIDIGIRGDYYQPDTKNYADTPAAPVSPLASTTSGAYRWQAGPYVTWHQSPFVRFRCEYNHADGQGLGSRAEVLWLQMIFAAGPHKHERY